MKTKLALISVLGAVVLSFVPGVARAEGTSCGFETIIIPDGRIQTSFISNATTFFYLISTVVGRSYSVEFHNRVGAAVDPPGVLAVFSDGSCAVAATTRNTVSIEPRATFNARRVSFTATTTQTRFTLANNSGAGIGYSFTASDTTQFHPGWSTGGGFETFYSIQNTTNSTCSVTLTLFNLAGAQVATTTQSIAANGLLATNTQTLGVANGLAGTGTLTHDCPPGGIFVDAAIANFGTSPAAIIPAKFAPVREATH